ncbi:MAG: hypothetical protein GY765_01190 [bacterium]|nr:hypothetical protein [bacterium]
MKKRFNLARLHKKEDELAQAEMRMTGINIGSGAIKDCVKPCGGSMLLVETLFAGNNPIIDIGDGPKISLPNCDCGTGFFSFFSYYGNSAT